jgi:GxxExxY protein
MNHEEHKEHEGFEFEGISRKVIGCAIEVHRLLGPGLLESSYEACLSRELALQGIDHVTQAPQTIEYKGVRLDCGYRIDILVENSLIVELKSVKAINPIHEAQLLTYMKLSGISTGLLLNFNVPLLKHGIKRFVL